jgi:CDP-diacylglycerol--glycerol-3-phosphate 3-phosphatidyltransferase
MLRNVNEVANRLKNPTSDWAHELMEIAFAPLVKVLQRLNISPNAITICGMALSLLAGVFLALGQRWIALGFIVLSGFLDGFDGLLARQTQRTSRFGAFLDSVLDRWSDSALLLGLLSWYSGQGLHTETILSGTALASSLLVSYTRARAEGIGAQSRRGLCTRLERFVLLIAGLVLNQMTIALWVLSILSTFTALQRIYFTWKYVEAHPAD